MTWFRRIEIFRRIRKMEETKARKYQTFFRMAYFFSTSTLLLYTIHLVDKNQKQEKRKRDLERLEAGFPVIEDESEAHAKMREQGVEAGELYKYTPEKGWHLEEYHRGEYLSRLQKRALEQAKEAQTKALEEGKTLPPDAILLVDGIESSDRKLEENN